MHTDKDCVIYTQRTSILVTPAQEALIVKTHKEVMPEASMSAFLRTLIVAGLEKIRKK